MKLRAAISALGTLLVFGFISCADNDAPANDPAVASGVIGSVMPMCMNASTANPSLTGLANLGPADFTNSSYSEEISLTDPNQYLYAFSRQVAFTEYGIKYAGMSYTLDGTMNCAFFVDMTVLPAGVSMRITSYAYAIGLSIVGPDFDLEFDADCRQVIELSSSEITITTDGLIAGRSFANSVITASKN
jgi:hypothetical protein